MDNKNWTTLCQDGKIKRVYYSDYVNKLEADIKLLKNCLRYYANETNWQPLCIQKSPSDEPQYYAPKITHDDGFELAKSVLKDVI